MPVEGGFNDDFKKEIQKALDEVTRSWYYAGRTDGIGKTLKLIFDQKHELKEQCQMCRKNRHDCCLVHRTFFFIELCYTCNCGCQSGNDLRKRLKKHLEV